MHTHDDFEIAKDFFKNALVPYVRERSPLHRMTEHDLKTLIVGYLAATNYKYLSIRELKAIIGSSRSLHHLTDKHSFPGYETCDVLEHLCNGLCKMSGEKIQNPRPKSTN